MRLKKNQVLFFGRANRKNAAYGERVIYRRKLKPFAAICGFFRKLRDLMVAELMI